MPSTRRTTPPWWRRSRRPVSIPALESAGPFTVFAPTNEAFAALPSGAVDTLLKPENKGELTKILTYHVVPGRYTAAMLERDVRTTPGGRVSLKTVEGQPLIVSAAGDGLMVTDGKGDTAEVTIPDVYQSNGVIMVVNKVLMPLAAVLLNSGRELEKSGRRELSARRTVRVSRVVQNSSRSAYKAIPLIGAERV